MKHLLLINLACMIILAIKDVYGYIDPGTGSMIFWNSIWTFIIGIMTVIFGFLLKYFYKPIRKWITIIWQKIKRKN